MTCGRYRDLLSRYIDGEVTPRQRRELLAHVERCHDCAAWLARARQADVLLKGVAETRPSDKVRDAVLNAARSSKAAAMPERGHGQGHHAPLRTAGAWHLDTAGFLLRFDVSPQRIALAGAAALLSLLALGYAFNLLPPIWGYTRFGFLFPQGQEQAAVQTAPLQAVSAGVGGVGGPVAAPNLVRLSPGEGAQGISPGEPLRIRFDQPMDRASVEGAWRIDPPAAGAFSWDADNEIRFTPTGAGLLKSVTYTVTVSNTAHSLAGTLLAAPLAWSFGTLNPPGVSVVESADSTVAPTSTFTLLFDTPMSAQDVGKEVSLRGGSGEDVPVSLAWGQDGKNLTVSPVAPLVDRDVTLRVRASARTAGGEPLGRAAEFTYTVGLPASGLRLLSGRVAVVDAGKPALVKYEITGTTSALAPRVALELYSVPGEKLSALGAGPSLPVGFLEGLTPFMGAHSRPVREAADPAGEAGNAGAQEVWGLPPGVYLLVASTASEVMRDWQLLVAANRRLQPVGAAGALWATDRDGKPWAGAEVSLYSPAWELVEKGVTDGTGLWLGAKDGASIAIARDGEGRLGAARLDPRQVIDQQVGDLRATLQTDQPVYYLGDTVSFRAAIQPGGTQGNQATPDAEQAAEVTLLNPQGAAVSTLTLKPDGVGGVSGLFNLATGIQSGEYTLRVGAGKQWRSFPLRVKAPEGDTLSVYAVPQPGEAVERRTVTYTVSVLGPDGQPVPGAALTATLGIRGEAWSSAPVTALTGPDGRATVSVGLPSWTMEDAQNGSFNDPALLFNVEAAAGGLSGDAQAPLDRTSARRALAGVAEMVSPSLGVAAVAQPQKDGATRLRLAALDAEAAQGNLLVLAQSPAGERHTWTLDLAAAGDVTLLLDSRFADGEVFFARSGVEGPRRLLLMHKSRDLALSVGAPRSVSPGQPISVTVSLADTEGAGLGGSATLLFRRVSGDDNGGRQSWQPSLDVAATGTASTTLAAPNGPGLWLLMCHAATADGASARAWSVVEVLPGPAIQLPPPLSTQAGEARDVWLTVYNPLSVPLSSGVQALHSESLDVQGSSSRGIEIAGGGWGRVNWRLHSAQAGQGSATFSFAPSAGVAGSWTLPVSASPGGHADVTYASGVFTGGQTVGVLVPSGLPDNKVQLEIHASSSLLSALADAVSGPTAQGAEKDTPAEAALRLSAGPSVASAYRKAGVEAPAPMLSGVDRSQALQQLYAAQHADGGWGASLDPQEGASSVTGTMAVLLAAKRESVARTEAGGELQPSIDSSVLDRALAYLTWYAEQPVRAQTGVTGLDTRAHALYVLSLYGSADTETVRPLIAYAANADGGPRLSRTGQAWLALALLEAGDAEDAQVLLRRLLAGQFAAGAEEVAPMLELLVKVGNDTAGLAKGQEAGVYKDRAREYAGALMGARQGGLWATPIVSADALWALSRYAAQESYTPGAPLITLNDKGVQSPMPAQPNNGGAISVAVPGSALHAGTNWLKLQAPREGQPLYYSLTLQATK